MYCPSSSRICPVWKHRFLRQPLFFVRLAKRSSTVFLPQHVRSQSTWTDTINSAQKLVQDPSPSHSSKLPTNFPFSSIVNPLKLVAPEMMALTGNIRMLLGSAHPTLAKVAKYYISSEGGKHIRPLIVLLVSKALSYNRSSCSSRTALDLHRTNQDIPISPAQVLNDDNPDSVGEITPSQRRLAEITEMIHAASLLHDDVIDSSLTRRNNPSCVSMFGNKMSILGGDFLLGRASVALARLRNAEVIELLATVIANLVEGEFMQLKNLQQREGGVASGGEEQGGAIDYYLRKTYLKTASLISKSCRAAAILGGASAELTDAAYSFGRNLGLAFQLVDDMLDYTAPSTILGKPTNADLALGLATAPVLFAWKDHPELGPMIKRKFEYEGDVARARDLVAASDGLAKTRELATEYSSKALEALHSFPECEERVALDKLTRDVLTRQK